MDELDLTDELETNDELDSSSSSSDKSLGRGENESSSPQATRNALSARADTMKKFFMEISS
jgi:hypothetical protein